MFWNNKEPTVVVTPREDHISATFRGVEVETSVTIDGFVVVRYDGERIYIPSRNLENLKTCIEAYLNAKTKKG